MDGLTTMSGSATSADPAFKQLLGGASGLTNGPHTLVLTNTGLGTAIDLDSFVFQGQAGSGYVDQCICLFSAVAYSITLIQGLGVEYHD